MAGRDFICRAVCPKLYGLQVIKLALLLTLIGGVSSEAYQGGGNQRHHQHQQEDSAGTATGPQPFLMPQATQPHEIHEGNTGYYGNEEDESHSRSAVTRRDEHAQVKTRRRDQSHILLVGDPGTGKTHTNVEEHIDERARGASCTTLS